MDDEIKQLILILIYLLIYIAIVIWKVKGNKYLHTEYAVYVWLIGLFLMFILVLNVIASIKFAKHKWPDRFKEL